MNKNSEKLDAWLIKQYTAWVRRRAIKAGVKPRSRSEAQALALKEGRAQHPTEGISRSEEVKKTISEGVAKSWEDISEEERKRRSEMSKKQRENMSPAEVRALHKAAGEGIRKAAKEGSKMENFIFEGLTSMGYLVEFHKTRFVANQNLEIDLFLPEHSIAIEIDGPSHFEPIWGEKSLIKTKRYDYQKSGLLVKHGICVLRVKHVNKNISKKLMRDALEKISKKVKNVIENFPEKSNLLVELEI
jgi:very-short-patch-repair endonuclease